MNEQAVPSIQTSITSFDVFESNTDQWPVYHAYEPLDLNRKAIRLIKVSRLPNTEAISCEFIYEDLNNKPEYSALSYYWGAPSEPETISLNGSNVPIRRNLYRFLQNLTSRFTSIVVWLDVLCINQQDVKERNWQVSLMQEIFESARNVYAWLGDGDADCKFAMRYISQSDKLEILGQSVEAKMLKQYLEQLFLQPYWTRVWIVQETVLAKQLWILYDTLMVSWTVLARTFDQVCQVDVQRSFPHSRNHRSLTHRRFGDVEDTKTDTEGCRRFLRIKKAKESVQTGQNTLHELLELFQGAACMDPRDKLYGLRGIASDGRLLSVDYSISPGRLFLESLSLERATIRRVTPSALDRMSSRLFTGITLCSCMTVTEDDFVRTLQDTKGERVHDWLTYHGQVSLCLPVDVANQPNSIRPCHYHQEIFVISIYRQGHIYYGTSAVRLGDKIYELTTPGDGHEESDEPLAPLILVFRNTQPGSRAIDQLITKKTFDSLTRYKTEYSDDLIRETSALRNTCVGRIEICPKNLHAKEVVQHKPGVLLAHISNVTMLALIAWFKARRIPKYIVDIVSREADPEVSFRCLARAEIDVNVDERGHETMTFQLPGENTRKRKFEAD